MAAKIKLRIVILTAVFVSLCLTSKSQVYDTLYAWADNIKQLRLGYGDTRNDYYIHADTLFFVSKKNKSFVKGNRIKISLDSIIMLRYATQKPAIPYKFINPQYKIVTKIFTYYVEGLDGGYKEFYTNGNIKIEGIYHGGTKIGKWTYYKKNGKVKKIIQYQK